MDCWALRSGWALTFLWVFTMEVGAFELNLEGWDRKGNKVHPGSRIRMNKSRGRGEESVELEKVSSQMWIIRGMEGVLSGKQLLGCFQRLCYCQQSLESEIITGTSESVMKLLRKCHCFWEAYEHNNNNTTLPPVQVSASRRAHLVEQVSRSVLVPLPSFPLLLGDKIWTRTGLPLVGPSLNYFEGTSQFSGPLCTLRSILKSCGISRVAGNMGQLGWKCTPFKYYQFSLFCQSPL